MYYKPQIRLNSGRCVKRKWKYDKMIYETFSNDIDLDEMTKTSCLMLKIFKNK